MPQRADPPRARFLKQPLRMFVLLAVAATVLASPPELLLARELPKGALFQVLPGTRAGAPQQMPPPAASADEDSGDAMAGWMQQLAVVRPHRMVRRAPTLQMFLTLSPVGRHGMGFRAIGSF